MDTETLKSLLPFLAWGALLFLMVRYGCAAHMMGRHGGHGGGAECHGTGATVDRDPVCGMRIDGYSATAAALHAGRAYYFCSTSCRDKFEQSPASYIAGKAGRVALPATGRYPRASATRQRPSEGAGDAR